MTITHIFKNLNFSPYTKKRFNNRDTMVMISLYPKKGEIYSTGTSGIASFAKNTVRHLHRNVLVLADYTKEPGAYLEDRALVANCFKKNTPEMWLQILKTLQQFPQCKHVLIQFDFALYGDVPTSVLFIPFLGILKTLGYKVTVVKHGVISDVFKLHGHLGLTDSWMDRIKGNIFNGVFRTFYWTLGHLTESIVVAEEHLREKLSKWVDKNKIQTIPHGVDTDMETPSKTAARKALKYGNNEMVILFFGFVSWFKGADFFVDTFQHIGKLLGKKVRFVIAGGTSATLGEKDYYRIYFAKMMDKIINSKNMSITGFVPQEDIGKHFAAADLVVFPYRYFMAASGVVSLAFSYKKPFIVSDELKPLFQSPDIKKGLNATQLKKDKIIFKLNKYDLIRTVERVLRNGARSKTMELSELMREERSWENTTHMYEQVVFKAAPAKLPARKLNYARL